MRNLNSLLGTLLLTGGLIGPLHAASISSTFDTDDEGWLVSGDATSSLPTYSLTGGNPGGMIEADDTVSGGVWYFDAPGKFLGDLSAAYAQPLAFDLKQTGSGSQFDAADVILNGGGVELRLDAGANPLPIGEWVSYKVLLAESAGWTNGGNAATQSDMLTVLGSLGRLRIRGEYISGSDTGRLDNVSVQVVPLPAAIWLSGSALAGLCLQGVRRRRSQHHADAANDIAVRGRG